MDQNNLQGGVFVPPPSQTPEIKLRTMESDINSVEKTGGSAPVPEFIRPLLKPETQAQMPEIMSKETTIETSGASKKALLWLFALLVAGAVVTVGYFYVWPLLSEFIMPFFNNAPLVDESEQTLPPATITPPVSIPSHKSYFGFSNDSLSKVVISDYSVISILTALQNASSPTGYNELKEILLSDNKAPVAFSEYISSLMPEITTSNLKNVLKEAFEDDFTAYLYYDDKGVWPGYIVSKRPNAEVDMVTLNNVLGSLEYSSFNNLFLSPPGNASPFRTGQVKNLYTDRFVPLSQPGASFNYGMFNNYLIINTSYGGLLKALELLGL